MITKLIFSKLLKQPIISKNKKMSINEIQLQSSLKTSFLNFVLTNLEIKQFIEPKIGNFYKIKF